LGFGERLKRHIRSVDPLEAILNALTAYESPRTSDNIPPRSHSGEGATVQTFPGKLLRTMDTGPVFSLSVLIDSLAAQRAPLAWLNAWRIRQIFGNDEFKV
jgi:hypothetical protein